MVGGGHFTAPSLRARQMQGRPHWWAVLAVSVALMALVTAASAGHHLGIATKTAGTPTQPPVAVTPSTAATHHTTATTAAGQQGDPTTTTGITLGRRSQSTGSTSVTSDSPTSTTTTTTDTAPTTVGSGAGSSPSQSNDVQSDQGYLDPPEDTSAVVPFSGSGPTTVSVTWSGATTLSLTANCGTDTQSASGSSPIAVTLTSTSGSCQATLTEPSSAAEDVDYTLTVGPAPGD